MDGGELKIGVGRKSKRREVIVAKGCNGRRKERK